MKFSLFRGFFLKITARKSYFLLNCGDHQSIYSPSNQFEFETPALYKLHKKGDRVALKTSRVFIRAQVHFWKLRFLYVINKNINLQILTKKITKKLIFGHFKIEIRIFLQNSPLHLSMNFVIF
jgi:hypothetical protein